MQKDKIETGKPVINLEEKLKSDSMENVLERLDALEKLTQPDGKGGQIVNVGDPSKDTDGVNKRYVDGNGARAYRATTDQAITTDTWTKIQLNAETFDIDGEFDPTTNYRFTAKKAGYYLVCGALKYQNVAASLPFHIAFYKNGAVYSQIRTFSMASAGDDQGIGMSDIIYLAIGDYVELWTWHYMGGPTKNILNGSDITFLSIYKLT